jgi:hypothetical protein
MRWPASPPSLTFRSRGFGPPRRSGLSLTFTAGPPRVVLTAAPSFPRLVLTLPPRGDCCAFPRPRLISLMRFARPPPPVQVWPSGLLYCLPQLPQWNSGRDRTARRIRVLSFGRDAGFPASFH